MTDVDIWEQLMAETVQAHLEEQADYAPGGNAAPGPGDDDDPLGEHYVDLGPLAYILNEALESFVYRGVDRDGLLDDIAEAASEASGDEGKFTAHDVEAVLTDDEHCPPPELLQGFAKVLSLETEAVMDAARKGGCTNLGDSSTPPPGF